jgi:predicted Zn-ribbon and HTH transcriptional regulator
MRDPIKRRSSIIVLSILQRRYSVCQSYNAPVEPLKRPFADWVEGRAIPAVRGFIVEHPLIWSMSIGGWWMGLRAIMRGEWIWLVGLVMMQVLFFGYLAMGWDLRRRRRAIAQKRAAHICLHCGYDMRATPDRCSECGHWAGELVEAEVADEQSLTLGFLADFLEEHPIYRIFILAQILAFVPLLTHGGIEFFLCFFGFIDLIMLASMAAEWNIQQRQFVRHLRHHQQLCIHCGYDLRATPDRCPECGRGANEG